MRLTINDNTDNETAESCHTVGQGLTPSSAQLVTAYAAQNEARKLDDSLQEEVKEGISRHACYQNYQAVVNKVAEKSAIKENTFYFLL